MITCQDLYGFLDDYLDDALDVRTRVAFKAHLAICRSCRRYLETYEASLAAAKTAEGCAVIAEPPEELVRAILAARGAATSDPTTNP